MNSNIYLSIIIPAYKEEKRISNILSAILAYTKKVDFPIETIVVTDGSPDNTVGVAQTYLAKIPNFRIIESKVNRGKGKTIREGINAAKGDFVLFADADNSTPIEQADKLLKYAKDYNVVIASRYCKGGELVIPQSFYRRLGGRAINLVIQTLLLPGINDTQCGFKLFKRELAVKIFNQMTLDRWSFDIEILAMARLFGEKIKEVGVVWQDNPHSMLSPLKDGYQMIKDAWKVRLNLQRKLYHD